MKRLVQSEWLDELPAGDPRAIRSRWDIGRINALMGNARIMARELKSALARHHSFHLIELGAGGGEFMLKVARRLRGTWPRVDVTLVDRQDALRTQTREEFAELKWQVGLVRKDVLPWWSNGTPERAEAIVANLFLHQLSDGQLRELFSGAATRARVLVAVEPRRSRRALFLCRCLWLLGCNSVTRHDAPVSVRAGFSGRELSALWPDPENWELTERPAGWLSHLFIARRRERVNGRIFQPIVSAVFERPAAASPRPADRVD